ncbi:fimbrial major subunit CsuA/B family protein [Paraburkholderia sp. NMBU_R16]|uniref:Csu type fimbrial protein n=1 Tax=Paraburkholderia sp. NMBU_R16 TaxID=2698676 RepID=UPI0015638ED5|nr:spore coat U domain-containing protein [Paraburkholderia sp. NMBU_R16]NRO94631.1 fimbrial major subunit CsuA/B family protein [Paraburkholderia sp. NMBU_R16]
MANRNLLNKEADRPLHIRTLKFLLGGVGFAGVFAFGPPSAVAATATATMAVSATVLATCAISAAPLAFGVYTGVQNDAATSLLVTCTNTTSYSIGLGAGTSGGTATARQMAGTPAGTLLYALFSDSGRTVNWGDTGGTGLVSGVGTGLPQTIPVYGRVAAGQLVAPGAYADTITATVTY